MVRIAGREIGEHKIHGGQSRRNFAHRRDAQQAKAWVDSNVQQKRSHYAAQTWNHSGEKIGNAMVYNKNVNLYEN
jgi:hypothetical protein